MFTKTFQQLKKTDTNTAGGKGASLGEMTSAGLPVPSGFVVLTTAFEEFLKISDLGQDISSILKKVDHNKVHTVEKASENIQSLILNTKIPQNIQDKIKKEFAKLDTRFVAVRSSATAEDSLGYAWAGQLDSFLNVDKVNLIKSIQKCWASLFTPRAIFYRFEKDLQDKHISVAVVVQTMVNSDKSGIAFSVHPVTEDYNQIIIEAGFGLGEAIVSGSITPDAYVVEKEDNKIIDINTNKQKKALYRKQNGGNEWKDLGEKGEKQVLNKKEILELASLIKKIENHYKIPQDIEWAQEDGKFFITQSRPITTLGNKNRNNDQNLHLQNIEPELFQKFMIRSFPLSFYEIWYKGEREGLPKICNSMMFFEPMFIYTKDKGTQVLYNMTDEMQIPFFLITYFNQHKNKFKNLIKKYLENYYKLTKLIDKNYSDVVKIKKICTMFADMLPILTMMIIIGKTNNKHIDKNIIKLSNDVRHKAEDFVGLVIDTILKTANELLPKKYKSYVYFLTQNEIINQKLPSIQELKKRQQGYIYYDYQVFLKKDLKQFLKKYNFKIIKERINKNKLIKGQVAYSGKIKGIVKKVFEVDQIDKIKNGDILVVSMTTPDLIAGMRKASAFVTDEGGITCHAAIMARELKKPCIIGTRFATQVLNDGELIEVDADNGVVNILKKANTIPLTYNNYQHFTQTKGKVSFGRSFGFLWHIKDMEGLVIYDGTKRRTFISKRKMQESLNEGNLLYSQKGFLSKLKKELKNNYLKLKKTIEQIEETGLNKKNLENFIQYIDELSRYYRYTDFFFTDKYFKSKKITKKEMEEFEQIKLDGRKYINDATYTENCFTNRLSIQASKKFNIALKDIIEYSEGEILNLFENKKIDINTINRRKIGYIIYADKNKNINTIIGKKALHLISSFVPTTNAPILKGQIASAGIARGRARVIHVSTDDFDSIAKVRKETKQGEILVTDSTIPEIIEACNKVNAIITNQGGMMSHAAIVSRELKIPCIVGVANATETIRTGDLLEVDANKGIIKII